MLGSNWGKLSKAIAGLAALIAVATAASLWYEADSIDHLSQIEAEQYADDQADAASIYGELECSVSNLSSDECEGQTQQAARPEQRGEYDLAAQRTMAAWTRAMGKAGVIGVAVGIFGLGLIFVTFKETRRAADAGFRANEIAEETSKRQLRAYVNVTNVKAEGLVPNAKPKFDVEIYNGGQTPAYDCEVQTFFHYCEGGDPDFAKIPLRRSNRRSSLVLLPGKQSWGGCQSDKPLETPEYLQILSGGGTMIFGGYITYRDIFGQTHRTLFRYFVAPYLINDEGTASLAASFRQNKSN